MKLAEIRDKAFAMPLTDPAYPKGPYRFYNREFIVITYRSDPDVLREVVPEPLELASDTVAYEFIRMLDSTGFGDYTETGQVIPVRFRAADGTVQEGGYVHAMYLDDNAPIAGGARSGAFPQNSRGRRSRIRAKRSSAHCITVRSCASRRRWATSIGCSILSR
jgi:acetoacetate decarboxylase